MQAKARVEVDERRKDEAHEREDDGRDLCNDGGDDVSLLRAKAQEVDLCGNTHGRVTDPKDGADDEVDERIT